MAHVGNELRLVMARDLQLAALLNDLLEQPRVAHGDHGLVGEGLNQLDLALTVGFDMRADESYDARYLALMHKRHAQYCPAVVLIKAGHERVTSITSYVGHLDGAPLQHDTAKHRTLINRNWPQTHTLLNLHRRESRPGR